MQAPIHNPGLKTEGRWSAPGFSQSQGNFQQGYTQPVVPQQLPQVMQSSQIQSPDHNDLRSQSGPAFGNPFPPAYPVMDSDSNYTHTPTQIVSPQNRGSCCRPPPDRNSAAAALPETQQGQSLISNKEIHYNYMQPQPTNRYQNQIDLQDDHVGPQLSPYASSNDNPHRQNE